MLFLATLISAPPVIAAKARQPVTVQILSISDWRGQVDPLVINGTQVGGAAVLSAYFKQERAANSNTLTLSSGGAVGASLPISSLFEDQPSVRGQAGVGFEAIDRTCERGLQRCSRRVGSGLAAEGCAYNGGSVATTLRVAGCCCSESPLRYRPVVRS